MTLIVSHLAPKFVIQVADRRLVRLPNLEPIEENATKVVLFNSNISFGYTGLANLPRTQRMISQLGLPAETISTHSWLVEALRLNPMDLAAALTCLHQELSIAFAAASAAAPGIGHAFIGVGWVSRKEGDALRPTLIEISNMDERAGVRPGFDLRLRDLAPGQAPFTHYSSPVHTKLEKSVRRETSRAEKADRGPATVSELLVRAVREAAKSNLTVGKGLLTACLPKHQVVTM